MLVLCCFADDYYLALFLSSVLAAFCTVLTKLRRLSWATTQVDNFKFDSPNHTNCNSVVLDI